MIAKSSIPEANNSDSGQFSPSHGSHLPTGGFSHSGKLQSDRSELHSVTLQPKRTVSQPEDPYEQEADQVAELVMRMPTPSVSSIEFSKIPIFPDQVQRKCTNSCDQKSLFDSSGPFTDSLLQLQRTRSIQAVQHSLKSDTFQAKLRISHPNDIYKQEADQIAEQVMRMPDPVLQGKCPKCDEDEEKILKAKEFPGHVPMTLGQDAPYSPRSSELSWAAARA